MTMLLKSLARLTITVLSACMLWPAVGMAADSDAGPAKDTMPHDNKATSSLKQKIDNIQESMDAAQDKRKQLLDAAEESSMGETHQDKR